MLDYKHIEALALVIREGGFDKAARALNITQSAVSQRVRQLEEQVGQVLLVRSAPPGPTPAGKRLLRHYMQVRHLEDELSDVLDPEARQEFISLPVGLNEDSLSTWFMKAVTPFIRSERVLLDLHADDQEVTHRMLRDGLVIGCVSSFDKPVQGCDMTRLGAMVYKLVAAPSFRDEWFPEGVTEAAVSRAPTLIFNHKDNMNNRFYQRALGRVPGYVPACYLPSTEPFLNYLRAGLAYSLLPGLQCDDLLESGELVELAPENHIRERLYWHCWSVRSDLLQRFSKAVIKGARSLLQQDGE